VKIAVSTDERTHLVDVVLQELERRGHEVIYSGPAPGQDSVDWPAVTLEAIRKVEKHEADEAIVMCWTGTGCSIVANKVPGIRAALCHDAETARGARVWNHANVLALSLRATPEPVVKEILDRWFDTPFSDDDWNLRQIAHVQEIEKGGTGRK
jgi:ribose 5-phosphate isomerase B